MAKKFPKSKDPQIKSIVSKKMRYYLFSITRSAHERLGKTLARPEIEKLNNNDLVAISATLARMDWTIQDRISDSRPSKVTKKKLAAAKKKTPRPKARRKG